MNNYESVYKNTGLVPRTLSEANKDATWSSPITHHIKSDLREGVEFLGGMLLGAFYVGLGASVAIGILMVFDVLVIRV